MIQAVPIRILNYSIDIRKGLDPIRRNWVLEREDVEEYVGREIKPEDNGYKES